MFEVDKEVKDKEGRYVMIVGHIGDMTIAVINVYFPNEEKDTFLNQIVEIITNDAKGLILMGGDFNMVQNNILDGYPSDYGPQTRKSRMLNNVTKELGLVDAWRSFNHKIRDYTFYSHPHKSYSRIDYLYISQQHIHKVIKSNIENITISDHAPIMLTLNIDNEPCFRYWRMNVSIICNENIVKEMKESLKDYFEINNNGEVSPTILWEGGKAVMRENNRNLIQTQKGQNERTKGIGK